MAPGSCGAQPVYKGKLPLTNILLVHYAEIGIKKGARPVFERQLARDIRSHLCPEFARDVRVAEARIMADLKPGAPRDAVSRRLSMIFGVAWYAFARESKNTIESIEAVVDDIVTRAVAESSPATFKVFVKRADKRFPLDSQEVAVRFGTRICEKFGLRVNLTNHDLAIHVEILRHGALVFTEKFEGLRGMPGRSSGRLLCLFSGGIDSPLAAWMMMRRGASVDLLHFHPYSRGQDLRESKIFALHDRLREYCPTSKLMLIPHYHYEVPASIAIPPSYEMVLFRRFMFLTAEAVARLYHHHGLVSGDCLGQVASQTIQNLEAVQTHIEIPLFHPLIAFDKDDIVRRAERIGTYELSNREYKDCCSLLSKRPKTRASVETVRRMEVTLDMKKIVAEAIATLEIWDGETLFLQQNL